EGDTLRFHEDGELFSRQIRRRLFDESRRRKDDVARSEDHFAAVGLQRLDLLARSGVNAAVAVFVALGEEVRLDELDVLQRRRIFVDYDENHELETSE